VGGQFFSQASFARFLLGDAACDFFAMDGDLARRRDAEAHAIAPHVQDAHENSLLAERDDKLFGFATGED
jgi:hypothetical protein